MNRIMRRVFAGLTTLAASSITLLAGEASAAFKHKKYQTNPSVSQVMNWFAEPEEGGQFDAQVTGLYQKMGLNMKTDQGGPQVSTVPLVASGKYTFGMASADTILLARAQGIPVVAIFAVFQTDPQVLIWHAGQPIHGFSDMNGHPVYVSSASPYWKYLVLKYHLDQAQQMQYTGSLVPFIHSPNAVIQGFVTNEPWVLKNKGVKVQYKLIADSGFNPYQNVLFTTEEEIQKHPDIVAKYVKASQQGWRHYFKDPGPAHAQIKKLNPDMSPALMHFAWEQEKPLIQGGDAQVHGIGYMTKARWQQLAKQLEQVGLLKPGFKVDGAFTNQFIPQK
ncbi:ABC transporter substrate-binding protein [Alicyclobacillus cellulosilyticus]|uniref:ABC transporter substrate-binding protein n=1 Tax=Alicyclobacillus cellulosilyticus TaxID=1003997 RepID=A0A917KIB4_9BACL|nr:ABC transporter substrate-binding protein [Alicyclobacillus cellulosilyticus]GGJ12728.1 ABC transporter substrate-binding protein [Alicyclobacillus cellulosilyticus]